MDNIFMLGRDIRGVSCGLVKLEARRWTDSTPFRFFDEIRSGCVVVRHLMYQVRSKHASNTTGTAQPRPHRTSDFLELLCL